MIKPKFIEMIINLCSINYVFPPFAFLGIIVFLQGLYTAQFLCLFLLTYALIQKISLNIY